MPPTVNARIPLSLLEAVRRKDTPDTDSEEEYVQELRNKRLGLSDTVIVQTPQITLVCPITEAERIKELVTEVTSQLGTAYA